MAELTSSIGGFLRFHVYLTVRFATRNLWFVTEFTVSDDFTNSQPIEPFKLTNAILQMGDNALFSPSGY